MVDAEYKVIAGNNREVVPARDEQANGEAAEEG